MAATTELRLRQVGSAAELADALAVRRRVFIEEQGVPESLEIDAYDSIDHPSACHVVGYLEDAAVAAGRLILDAPPAEYPHVGRVAVLREWRGHGLGRQLMLALHDLARVRGRAGITLAAQLHAIGFYERLGYRSYGDVFLDAGIEHRWMDLAL